METVIFTLTKETFFNLLKGPEKVSPLKKTCKGISRQLSDSEKLEKRLDWTKKSIKSLDDILLRYYG